MEVRDSPCRSFHFPGNGARKISADAKLEWEEVGRSPETAPEKSLMARDGRKMALIPWLRRQKKSLLCPKNCGGWVTPRGRYDEHSRKFRSI